MDRIAAVVHFLLFLTTTLGFISCDAEQSPIPVPPQLKNPRTYSWTVDTIAYQGSFQTDMRAIWGSTPKNVYVVGTNDRSGPGTMYRYDGNRWSTTRFHVVEGGGVNGAVELYEICGVAQNDIFVVGEELFWDPIAQILSDTSLIIHYDGNSWTKIPISPHGFLLDICVSQSHTGWAVGYGNYYYKLNGQTWALDSISITPQGVGEFSIYSVAMNDAGQAFAFGRLFQQHPVKETYYFLQDVSGHWSVIDSALVTVGLVEEKWGYANLWFSPGGKLFSVGDFGVFVWDNTRWSKVCPNFTMASLTNIYGVSDYSIFVVGVGGTVLHYNGSDWVQLSQFINSDLVLSGIWTDGKEAFIVGTTGWGPEVTVVFHGK